MTVVAQAATPQCAARKGRMKDWILGKLLDAANWALDRALDVLNWWERDK